MLGERECKVRVVKSFNQANEEQRFTNVSDELRDVNIQIGYFLQ